MKRPDFAEHLPLLREMAKRYVWWNPPTAWDEYPEHTIAYVLRYTDAGRSERLVADQDRLLNELGNEAIRYVFATAEPNLAGIFTWHAWVHWHLRLGMSATENDVPPLPKRHIPPA